MLFLCKKYRQYHIQFSLKLCMKLWKENLAMTSSTCNGDFLKLQGNWVFFKTVPSVNVMEGSFRQLSIKSYISIDDSIEAGNNEMSSWMRFNCDSLITVSCETSNFSRPSSVFFECNTFCSIIEEDNHTFAGQSYPQT